MLASHNFFQKFQKLDGTVCCGSFDSGVEYVALFDDPGANFDRRVRAFFFLVACAQTSQPLLWFAAKRGNKSRKFRGKTVTLPPLRHNVAISVAKGYFYLQMYKSGGENDKCVRLTLARRLARAGFFSVKPVKC